MAGSKAMNNLDGGNWKGGEIVSLSNLANTCKAKRAIYLQLCIYKVRSIIQLNCKL